MKLKDFSFNLPEELIAQHPIEKRDESRLLLLNKKEQTIEHKTFKNIIDYLNPGDCLVINNTKVIPARLYGIKKYQGQAPENPTVIEFLLLTRVEGDKWEVLVKPGRKLPIGAEVIFDNGTLRAKILDILENGNRLVEFYYEGIFNEILDKVGIMPLPHYIKETLKEKDRYQTVYAKHEGACAAPTAGLHFTPELLEQIEKKGIKIVNVTLHVGIGTFRPVKAQNIKEHQMHSEHYFIDEETANIINETKKNGSRVIAVGTTSCRVLETVANEDGKLRKQEGDTSIFIYPGYKFKVVDALITNFHLPESSLIMLVSALAGREYIMEAYEKAIEEKYRFFSFGDSMFIY